MNYGERNGRVLTTEMALHVLAENTPLAMLTLFGIRYHNVFSGLGQFTRDDIKTGH